MKINNVSLNLTQQQLGKLELYTQTRVSSGNDIQKAIEIVLESLLGGK